MGKIIEISKELEDAIVFFCDDELNWHINDCVPIEYDTEIKAQIELLRLLEHDGTADIYENEYKEWKWNNRNETLKDLIEKVYKGFEDYTIDLKDGDSFREPMGELVEYLKEIDIVNYER